MPEDLANDCGVNRRRLLLGGGGERVTESQVDISCNAMGFNATCPTFYEGRISGRCMDKAGLLKHTIKKQERHPTLCGGASGRLGRGCLPRQVQCTVWDDDLSQTCCKN